MSATLLEGVAVLVVIGVAWQIGVRLAPDILGLIQRAIAQLNSNYPSSSAKQDPKPNLTIDSSTKKEEFYDTEDHQPD